MKNLYRTYKLICNGFVKVKLISASILFLLLMFVSVLEAYSQLPQVTVRFANPTYDCSTLKYCVDVEFQSNTPLKQVFGMNVRFFYDSNVLDFVEFADFEPGYGPISPDPPIITTGNPSSGPNLFGMVGPAEFLNGAIMLVNNTAAPIYISTTGWTRLYSACFTIEDPSVLNVGSFCPILVWDMEEDPSLGGFLAGDDGVVITVVEAPPLESAPAQEAVVQYNWAYDGVAGIPFGFYTATNCISTFGIEVDSQPLGGPACFNESTDISVSVFGGSGPFHYQWQESTSFNGPFSNVLNGGNSATYTTNPVLSDIFYKVIITDLISVCGTVTSDTIGLNVLPPFTVSISDSIDATCYGGNNGSATVSTSGGNSPFLYLWDANAGNQTTSVASALTSGNYIVTVTDANQCNSTTSVLIGEASEIVLSTSSVNASCGGGLDGSATVVATGGTPGYTYLWDSNANNQTTATATNLAAGFYTVTVFDSENCSVSTSIEVSGSGLLFANATSTPAGCGGAFDGTATVTATGGVPPIEVLWDINAGSQTTATAVGLAVGTYSVTISDANGCSASTSVTVEENNSVVASVSSTNVNCYGIADGTATAFGSGGATPYTYLWSDINSQTTATATGLSGDTYFVSVSDALGCLATAETTISEPSTAVSALIVSHVDVVIYGSSTGSAVVEATGGTPPYTYLWNDLNSQSNDTAINLPAGTYEVTVTDNNGCTDIATVLIVELGQALSAIITSQTMEVCFNASNGTATVEGVGGLPPYTYLWDAAASSQTTATATGLSAGTYFVTVTDSNFNTAVASVTISQPASMLVGVIGTQTDVLCFGENTGTAIVNATGGTSPYSYLWDTNTGNQTSDLATNLSAGYYEVTITDSNNCIATTSVTITEPDNLTAIAVPINVLCKGDATGSVEITPAGGTGPYTITPAQTGLTAGFYTFTVEDANGCTVPVNVTISEPSDVLSASSSNQINVLCKGDATGSVEIIPAGGTGPYTISPAQTGLTAGFYTFTVEDANGCTTPVDVTITEPLDVLNVTLATTDASCNGGTDGTATLTATGGTSPYVYLWDNGASDATVTGLSAGIYDITVSDANGCTAISNAVVSQASSLIASTTSTNASCNGGTDGTVTVTATGGTSPYTYLWDNGTSDATALGLSAGIYNVTISDANGCTAFSSATINEPTALIASASATSACNTYAGGIATVSVSGGTSPYTYLWDSNTNNNTTASATGLISGSYSVTVTDFNGCISSTSVVVDEPIFIDINILPTHVLCSGDSNGEAAVSVSGGSTPYTYLWSNGQTSAITMGLSANSYDVTVTDTNGCSSVASVTITEPSVINATISNTAISCNGALDGTATVSATGGTSPYTYLWDANAGNATTAMITGLAAGTYNVSVFDANLCSVSANIVLNDASMLMLDILVNDVNCNGGVDGSATVTVSGGTIPYTYLWDTNAGSQVTETATGLAAGTYTLTVMDANSCIETASVNIDQPNILEVSTVSTGASCNGGNNGTATVIVSGGTPNYSYLWNNGQTTATATGLISDTYFVTVTDFNSCIVTASVFVDGSTSLAAVVNVTDVTCNGLSDGTAEIIISGGTTPYTYTWDSNAGNQTTASISGLSGGTYFATVIDPNGCSVVVSAYINENSILSISLDATDVMCMGAQDGFADVIVSGGQAPYSYTWSNGSTNQMIDSLLAGSYCVTVSDANACNVIDCVNVNEPQTSLEALYLGGESIVTCNGSTNGWAQVIGTGGVSPYQYSFNYGNFTNFHDSAMTYTNLPAGLHLLTIGDSNNCEILYEIEITEPDILQLAFNVENVLCNGALAGSIDMTIQGGTLSQYDPTCNCNIDCHSIVWSNGATTEDISGLDIGTYTVTVSDCNGCMATGTAQITEPSALLATYTQINPSCYGNADGEIDLTIVGGTPPYTYLWNTGETLEDLAGLMSGAYSATISDANGCQTMVNVALAQSVPVPLDFAVTNIQCTGVNNGAIDLLLQDAACMSYTWSNGASTQDINNLYPGWYWVTVVDCNGCVSIDSACVYAPNNPLFIDYTVNNVLCNGGNNGSIDIAGVGGTLPYVGIQWTGVVPTLCCGLDTVVLDSVQNWGLGQYSDVIENLAAGTYYVTLTDAYGCEAYSEIEVTEPTCPVHIANQTIIDAEPGTLGAIDIYVCCGSFPYTYYWEYNGSYFSNLEDIDDLQSGEYTVLVTDANGCSTTGSFVLNSTTNPGWSSEIGESSHIIYIPETAVPNLSIGDYIGVFYDSLGTQACGGYTMWNGTATTIAAWGDDGIDPSDETGFVNDEVFSWVVWDSGTETEYPANVTYNLGPMWPSDSTYEVNGVSALASINMIVILDNQVINLTSGWNLISTYIDPAVNNITDIFAPIVSQVAIVKDGDGLVYWPQYSLDQIGSFTMGKGYKLKMASAQTLTIEGTIITPETNPITIPSGWSLLGYLRNSPASITDLLSDIVSNVIIVKNGNGNVYWPAMFGINSIGNMVPGQGYHIKMTTGDVLTYPPNGTIAKSAVFNLETNYFKLPSNSGSNMTIGIPQSAWTSTPSYGDEIAVINNNGDVLGASVYTNGAMSISLWGDDDVTEKVEGLSKGESFSFAVWNKISKAVTNLEVISWEQGNASYDVDAISIVGKFADITDNSSNYALYQNMPNPFSNSTQIKFHLPKDTHVHIGVYNLIGDLVEELVGAELAAGEHSLEFNADNLAVGSYFYRIITDDYVATKKMNLIK